MFHNRNIIILCILIFLLRAVIIKLFVDQKNNIVCDDNKNNIVFAYIGNAFNFIDYKNTIVFPGEKINCCWFENRIIFLITTVFT